MSTAPIAQGPVECRVMPHTPGPWELGEFDKHLGYDCMTGGVRAGPAVLDGSDYGQKWCAEIDPEAKARMLADAALIAAAPALLKALIEANEETKLYPGHEGRWANVIAMAMGHNMK